MTKINTTNTVKIMTDKEVKATIKGWEKQGQTWQAKGQSILVAILTKWKADGDVSHVISYANQMDQMKVSGMRKNALRQWFEVVCKFEYNVKEKTYTYLPENTKYTGTPENEPTWFDINKEEAYTPFNELVKLEKLVKEFQNKLENPKEGDFISRDTVKALEAALEVSREAHRQNSVTPENV